MHMQRDLCSRECVCASVCVRMLCLMLSLADCIDPHLGPVPGGFIIVGVVVSVVLADVSGVVVVIIVAVSYTHIAVHCTVYLL